MINQKRNINNLVSSKKGNVLIVGLIFFLLVGLIFLITVIGTQHYLLGEVNTLVQEDDSFTNTTKNVSQELTDRNNTAWDNGFALLIGGLMVGLFLAGATLNNNPVVLGVVLVILIFSVYAGMHIVNIYEDISDETTDTLNFSSEFPKANVIMSNLVLVIIGGIALLGLGIFTSNRIGI